ncbi:hypothetical protein PHISP_05643 [Aspergillus sp. HF37]|nr:hypothetical protein PHISP_05643 [Aspergillus sp. HF37]
MLSFIRFYAWKIWSAVQRFLSSRLFGSLLPSSFGEIAKTPDPEQPKESASQTSAINASPKKGVYTYTFNIRVQYQHCLDLMAFGAFGHVYKVDEDIVLKSRWVYEHLPEDASPRDRYDYASESIYHFSSFEDERTVSKLLEQRPHPNIVEVVDTAYPEGVYLRKYRKHSEITTPTQPRRILWYQDILRALLHLHKLRIAHSDLRIDNVLFDEQGHAFLCDFSSCSAFGELNHESPHPDFPFPLNGLEKTFSDATDVFAMGSLIFSMEFGHKPDLAADNGVIVLPPVHTGHGGLDSIIQKAWLGKYASTVQMLGDVEALQGNITQDPRGTIQLVSKNELRERVRQWRRDREEHHGCVLYSFLSDEQLQQLADQYGINIDGERRLLGYRVPS